MIFRKMIQTLSPVERPAPGAGNMAEFQQFYRRTVFRTLIVNGLLIITASVLAPHWVEYLIYGMVFGLFYLWSLGWNARHPKGNFQFVFSLTRMMLLAYGIVCAAKFRILETGVVICGFLSYKIVLLVECLGQCFQKPGLSKPEPPKT